MKVLPFHRRNRHQFLYHELYTKTRENLLALIEVRLANKKIVGSTLENSVVHQFLYLEAFWLWMLDYTAGEPIAALAPRISGIVDKFEEWNAVDQFCQQEAALEFPDYGPYEYNGAPDFSTLQIMRTRYSYSVLRYYCAINIRSYASSTCYAVTVARMAYLSN
ncbi:hypothetical protein ACQ4WY_23125 [Janthinobacterium sp. LB2P49]|uniref:hypothetical protein n=1 Tax=Janthinobacterium sp. LB2P49 TaxID=3424198 RepID=UPI003F1F34DE